MTFASITLTAKLKTKADQRFTPSNVSVVSFLVDIVRYDNRAKQEKVYPVKVNLWGDAHAKNINQLVPGTEVIIIGRPQIEQYNDREGNLVKAFVIEGSKLSIVSASSSGASEEFVDDTQGSFAPMQNKADDEFGSFEFGKTMAGSDADLDSEIPF